MSRWKSVLICAVGLMLGADAGACICRRPALAEYETWLTSQGLESRIFLGTVLSEERKASEFVVWLKWKLGDIRYLFGGQPYDFADSRWLTRFAVTENFAGPAHDVVVESEKGTCGPIFERGKQYLVVATRKHGDDAWYAAGCTPTGPIDRAREDLEALRKRKSTEEAENIRAQQRFQLPNNALQPTCEDARG
jgi:hypothetical protein